MSSLSRTIDAYLDAKHAVLSAGFGDEIDWQNSLTPESISEADFLSETAWVILSAGFREKTVRSRFSVVSAAFLDWRSAQAINRHADRCVADALKAINHRRKMHSIAAVAATVTARGGFARMWTAIRDDPIQEFASLPYVGPVTSLHLAKNLGFDVVKPDRHLLRISRALQWGTVDGLCSAVSSAVGDRKTVVDLVFWRFATLCPDYIERLAWRA